jgi:hypothetical protein
MEVKMAIESLPAMPSSHNDIESLAKLLEGNFHYHSTSTRIPSYKEEYITNLNLTLGLSLTAMMVDGSLVSTHKAAINRFLDSFCFYNNRSQCNSIKPVALEAARIMYEAACIFPRLKSCRELNEVFRKALGRIVRGGLLDKKTDYELSTRLLETMLRNPYY